MRGCKQRERLRLYGSLICWHPVRFAVKRALFLIIPLLFAVPDRGDQVGVSQVLVCRLGWVAPESLHADLP